jgi:hypothetical protein
MNHSETETGNPIDSEFNLKVREHSDLEALTHEARNAKRET